MIKYRSKFFYVIAALVFLIISSCQKENPIDDGDDTTTPKSLNVILNDLEYYKLEMGMLETEEGDEFADVSASIDNITVPTRKINAQTIAFVIPDTITTGAKQLKVVANGKDFNWNISVKSAPENLDVTQITNDFEQEVILHRNTVKPLMDSIAKRLDSLTIISHLPASTTKMLDDSLDHYLAKIKQLPPASQKLAAKIIYPRLQEMKEIRQLSEELLKAQLDNLRNQKKSSCNSEFAAECVLSDARQIISKLQIGLKASAFKGAFLGVATGLIAYSIPKAEAYAWDIGASATILYMGFFASKEVYTAWDELQFSTFNSIVSETDSYVSSNKKQIDLTNGVPQTFNYRLIGKNVSSTDKKYNVTWINLFISAFDRFRLTWMQTMPEWVNVTPDYAPTLKIPHRVKMADYLSIEEISNPKVKLDKFLGTSFQPRLVFTTEETTEQSFSFRIKYFDGLFEVLSEPIECVLKHKGKIFYVAPGFQSGGSNPETFTNELMIDGVRAAYLYMEHGKYIGAQVLSHTIAAAGGIGNISMVNSTSNKNFAASLSLGTVVNGSNNYQNGASISDYTVMNGKTTTSGIFGANQYIGFKFWDKSLSKIYYGWMKVSIASNASYFIIHEYAFNTEPGKEILVGQKE